ncbi:MAG: YggS family pyridoxal phosphate-dependent enzyme, partial [Bradyrhizobium sp.]|nr:YggS family pyridoxal phosphate-dependent enzyme [Bradyrhizobium sp.]
MAPQIPSPITTHLPNGLATVEHDIARACEDARRDRQSVTLIAVSKTFDADAIMPVIEAG